MPRREFKPSRHNIRPIPNPIPHTQEAERAGTFARGMFIISSQLNSMLDDRVAAEAQQAGLKTGAENKTLQLRPDATIADREFNRAAITSFTSKTEINARTEIDRIFEENKADPVIFRGAVEDYKRGVISGLGPEPDERILLQINEVFERNTRALERTARRNHQELVISQAKADAFELLESKRNSAGRLAMADESDIEAAADLSLERESYIDTLVGLGPKQAFNYAGDEVEADDSRSGVLGVDDIVRLVDDFDDEVYTNRVIGKFNRASNKQAFIDQFELNELNNQQSPLDVDQVRKIASQLRTLERADRVERNLLKIQLRDQVRDAEFVMSRGVMPNDIDSLMVATQQFPDLLLDLTIAKQNAAVMGSVSKMHPVQQRSVINALAAEQPGTRQGIELLESLQKIHSETTTMLENDPASLMAMNGEPVPPLNIESIESLKARQQLGLKIEATYGREAHGLTNTEVTQIDNALDTLDADGQSALMARLQAGLGDHQTALLMEQIAPKHPEFAVAAGISNDIPSVSRDILVGQQLLINNPGTAPNNSDVNIEVDEVLGNIYPPEVRGQITQAAIALDAAHRFRQGKSAKEEFDPGDFQDALLAITGPIIEFNGEPIPSPRRDWDEDDFENFMNSLNDASLGSAIPFAGDKPVTMDMIIQNGTLVAAGDGQYMIMIGNGYATVEDGSAFIWDIRELAANAR